MISVFMSEYKNRSCICYCYKTCWLWFVFFLTTTSVTRTSTILFSTASSFAFVTSYHHQHYQHHHHHHHHHAILSKENCNSLLFSSILKFGKRTKKAATAATTTRLYASKESSASASTTSTTASKSKSKKTTNTSINTKIKTKDETLVETFVSHLLDSIHDESFVSLTLRGVKIKKKGGKKNSNDNNEEESSSSSLRGSIRQIQGRLIQMNNNNNNNKKNNKNKKQQQQQTINTNPKEDDDDNNDNKTYNINNLFLQLTIKYHGATDICKNLSIPEISTILPKIILHHPSAITSSEWGMDAVQANPIRGAELQTLTTLWDLQLSTSTNNNNDDNTISKSKLTQQRIKKSQQQQQGENDDSIIVAAGPTSHDRMKNVPVSTQSDFLQALGVTNTDGKPRPGMKSKLKQCQKFVEIVGGLVEKLQSTSSTKLSSSSSELLHPKQRPISVVDMGCGRGYLTFALHHYLVEKYRPVQQEQQQQQQQQQQQVFVQSQGIDVRPKLVSEISDIAKSLGPSFATLTFKEGTIEDVVEEATLKTAPKSSSSSSHSDSNSNVLNILIALHACDTATDDAIWSGICQNVDLIVVAPCCHQQVRSQLDAHFVANKKKHNTHHPLMDMFQHGIYRERCSEMVTDSLRALLLELAGYKVQVFEFIGGEHTSKNVMITAVKQQQKQQQQQGHVQSNNDTDDEDVDDGNNAGFETLKDDATAIRERILALSAFHGIQKLKLVDWMEEEYQIQLQSSSSSSDDDDENKKKKRKKASSSTRGAVISSSLQMPSRARP